VIDASPAAIKPAARHGEPAQVFPANAAPPGARPRMDGVICGCRSLPGKRCRRFAASAATRLIGQNRSGAVLFPSANNPPREVWCSVNA